MRASNADAARILREHGARACTDVTGFGLAGHLREMLDASGVAARLSLAALPALPGALELAARGVESTLAPDNLAVLRSVAAVDGGDIRRIAPHRSANFWRPARRYPAANAARCVDALAVAGIAAAIGRRGRAAGAGCPDDPAGNRPQARHDRHLHRRRRLPGARGGLPRRPAARPARCSSSPTARARSARRACRTSRWSRSARAPDVADDWIAERIAAADVCVTADIPLASRCLADGRARAGADRPAVDRRTTSATRSPAARSRGTCARLGVSTGGPAPLTKADRSRFLSALDTMVNAALRGSPVGTGRPRRRSHASPSRQAT